jgi:hypothetical protein
MLDDKKQEMIFNKISLSFLTTPFLLGLITVETILEGLKEMGQASEELFRGDRLPILNFPLAQQEKT